MDSKLDDDEDVFPYNGMPRRSYGQSQSQSQYYQQSSSSPFWQVVMRTLDVCTGPNFGLLVAFTTRWKMDGSKLCWSVSMVY
jgi:hypothetical protein